jgi:hypothetical protein
MLKLSSLLIDPRSLGEKVFLVDVSPIFQYTEDKKRTDIICAYRYTIVLPKFKMEKIGVKIEGAQQISINEGDLIEVKFEALLVSLYQDFTTREIGVRAAASGIKKVSDK